VCLRESITFAISPGNIVTAEIEMKLCFLFLFSRCLVKNPDERATATELLQNEFIGMAQPASILSQMIAEAKEIRENLVYRLSGRNLVESVSLPD
jgi:hypothetical protein